MNEVRPEDLGETRTVEVRVYRHGELVHRELCESEEQAVAAVEEWAELDGVECEVDDLSARHRGEDVLEPELVDAGDEYPTAVETGDETARRW